MYAKKGPFFPATFAPTFAAQNTFAAQSPLIGWRIQSIVSRKSTWGCRLKLVLFFLAKGLAFAAGAGFLGFGWLLGAAVIDYTAAIFSEGHKAPGGDFRNLSDADFGKSENNIKMATVRKLAFSALAFGAGYLALALGLFG